MGWAIGILFIVIASLNLYTQSENAYLPLKIRRISKSLLMPFLALTYMAFSYDMRNESGSLYIIMALLMSWIGDVWLMGKVRQHEEGYEVTLSDQRFLLGLIFFFVGHVFYAIVFLNQVDFSMIPKPIFAFLILLLWYGIILFKGVKPSGAIKIGMVFYMLAIGSMIFSALCIYVLNMNLGSLYLLIGAVLFGSSDSVLAFQCIRKVEFLPDSYVMFSYIGGQMFLVLGFYLMNF